MKYWFDTEFIERPFGVELISIGMVAEDGRELYVENSEIDWSLAHDWVLQHVKPQLTGRTEDLENISYMIRSFIGHDERPEFWGFYCAFDWVALCGLFGGLGELPFHFPQICLDLRQWQIALGDPELPAQAGGKHNALADARWTKLAWEHLAAQAGAAALQD